CDTPNADRRVGGVRRPCRAWRHQTTRGWAPPRASLARSSRGPRSRIARRDSDLYASSRRTKRPQLPAGSKDCVATCQTIVRSGRCRRNGSFPVETAGLYSRSLWDRLQTIRVAGLPVEITTERRTLIERVARRVEIRGIRGERRLVRRECRRCDEHHF